MTLNITERQLQELEQLVESLLNRDQEQANGVTSVQLAENVQVNGRWIEREMRPRVAASPASGSLTIAVHFGNSFREHHYTSARCTCG